jgi:hypothetical protein
MLYVNKPINEYFPHSSVDMRVGSEELLRYFVSLLNITHVRVDVLSLVRTDHCRIAAISNL